MQKHQTQDSKPQSALKPQHESKSSSPAEKSLVEEPQSRHYATHLLLASAGGGSSQPATGKFSSLLTSPQLSHPTNAPVRNQAVLQMQRDFGNSYVQRVLQPKLTIGRPGDKYEQEADRVAEQVMRMPEPIYPECREEEKDVIQAQPLAALITPLVQRQTNPKEIEKEEEELLQTKHSSGTTPKVSPDFASRIEAMKGKGQPLPKSTLDYFEPRFGHDFHNVRVHTNTRAVKTTQAVNAQAFTIGKNVMFGEGQYAPETATGKRLLAHELTHVVQQAARTTSTPLPPRSMAGYGDVYEREAEVTRNELSNVSVPVRRTPAILQKSPRPFIMRTHIFTSTIDICHNYLKSREFHISEGGLIVTTRSDWEFPEWQGTEPPECGPREYSIELRRVGLILDSPTGACRFPIGRPFTRQWTNLPEDDYYLGINVFDHNPICCLRGDIIVSQESGLSGEGCTQAPASPLEILHAALDIAGLIPALGVIPDGINLIIYAAEGDWVNTGISAAAILPIIGGAAVVVRRGRQVVRVSGEAVEQVGRRRIAAGLREASSAGAGRLPRFLRNKMRSIRNAIAAGGTRGIPGTVTNDEAMQLGRQFVGPDFRVMSNRRGLVSADGLRQFRFPSPKRGIDPMTGEPFSRTGVQVNFEARSAAAGPWTSNVHLDVSP